MSTHLPADVADKMLDNLINDDAFRDLFEKDARAALHQIGYDTPKGDLGIPGRDPVLPLMELKGGLAPKEKLAANRGPMMARFKAQDATKSSLVAGARTGGAPLPFGQFDVCCDD